MKYIFLLCCLVIFFFSASVFAFEDITDLRETNDFLWAYIFGSFGGLIVFYLLLQYILKQQKKPEITKISQEEMSVSKSQEHTLFFENLGKKSQSLSSQVFFREYNNKIREIFAEQGITRAETKTLKELKGETGLKKSHLFALFQKSYAYEYSSRDISIETRQKYIEDIISLL